MRVGIAALGRISQDTGAKNYVINLIRALSRRQSADEYTLFVSGGEEGALPPPAGPLRTHLVERSSASPYQKVWAEQAILPGLVRRLGIDRMLFPSSMASYRCPVPYVLNVRATVSFYRGLGVRGPRRILRNWLIPRSARRANWVIAPSQHMKRDVERFCRVDGSRIRVIPHGVDAELFARPMSVAERDQVLSRYGLARRVKMILYVSALLPHKNHELLLRAFRTLIDRTQLPHLLVLVGRGIEYGLRGRVDRLAQLSSDLGLGARVVFTGDVPQEHLPAFYQSGELMVFPSRIESFGNPVVEAMAAGMPVVSSSAHALPEVAGNAAVLVSADDEPGWVEAMARVLSSPALRDDLAERGRRRARQFSWSRCFDETFALLS